MYMLLALAGAALFWLLFALIEAQRAGAPARRLNLLAAGYALVAAAGLWTHYSFPILLAAAGIAWLIDWLVWARRARPMPAHIWRASPSPMPRRCCSSRPGCPLPGGRSHNGHRAESALAHWPGLN